MLMDRMVFCAPLLGRVRAARMVAIVLVATSLGGCAYLTTYNKQVALDGHRSVAMDVKQRVVISQSRVEKDGRAFVVTCAEPSPDALTVIGASAGGTLGLTAPQGPLNANIAIAQSESGAFVGLRTQSIQLLRDAMYRLCEAYAAGAIDSGEYEGMQRRFQSTVMGLIAIEQLTRPVVAGQALLTSNASAQGGAGAGDAQVQAAQGRVTEQRAKVTTAENAVDNKQTAVRETRALITAENAKLKTASAEAAPAHVAEIERLRKQLNDDELAVRNARREAEQEREALAKADAALQRTEARAVATSSAGGQLGEMSRNAADSTEKLAAAVNEIVREINSSYMRDSCFNLYSRYLYHQDEMAMKVMRLQGDLAHAEAAGSADANRMRDAVRAGNTALVRSTDHFKELQAMCNLLQRERSTATHEALQLRLREAELRAITRQHELTLKAMAEASEVKPLSSKAALKPAAKTVSAAKPAAPKPPDK